MPWSDYPLRSLQIPQGAAPGDPQTIIGGSDVIPAELAAYYLANHAATFVSVNLEYFGGLPNPYHYRAVTGNPAFGSLQIAEGYVVWDGAVPNVAPERHCLRPGNTLGALRWQVQHDPDDVGSSTFWSPNSSRAFDIQTVASTVDDFPFVKWNGDPLNVIKSDYLGQGVADLTLSSADQFVAGDLSFVTHGDTPAIYILAVFDFDVTVAAAGQRVVGTLYRDGAAVVVPLATLTQVAVGRATVAQLWQYIPSNHNSHTFQIQARKTGAGGTAICRQNSTRLMGLCIDPISPA